MHISTPFPWSLRVDRNCTHHHGGQQLLLLEPSKYHNGWLGAYRLQVRFLSSGVRTRADMIGGERRRRRGGGGWAAAAAAAAAAAVTQSSQNKIRETEK